MCLFTIFRQDRIKQSAFNLAWCETTNVRQKDHLCKLSIGQRLNRCNARLCVQNDVLQKQTMKFGVAQNNEHRQRIEWEREIMCEQIAINLINIFFLFVPNIIHAKWTKTTTMTTNERRKKTTRKEEWSIHRKKPTYVRLIYWVFISNKYRHLAHKSTQPFITLYLYAFVSVSVPNSNVRRREFTLFGASTMRNVCWEDVRARQAKNIIWMRQY